MDGFLPLEIDYDYMSQLYEDMDLLLKDETIYEDEEISKRVFRYTAFRSKCREKKMYYSKTIHNN